MRSVASGQSLYVLPHCTAYLLRDGRKTFVPFGDATALRQGGFLAPVSMNRVGLTESGRSEIAEVTP